MESIRNDDALGRHATPNVSPLNIPWQFSPYKQN